MIKPLSNAGKAFFGSMIAVGGSLFVACTAMMVITYGEYHLLGYLGLFALALLASRFSLKIPGINSVLALSDTFIFTAVLFFGPAAAAVLGGTEALISTRRHSKRWLSALASLSVITTSVFVAGTVYRMLLGLFTNTPDPSVEHMILPLLGLTFTNYVLNSGLIATLTAFARRIPIVQTWRENYAWTVLNFAAGAFAAGILHALILRIGPWAILVCLPIIVATYLTYRIAIDRLEEKNRDLTEASLLQLRVIEALAMAINSRGRSSPGHLRRVQAYALGLCEKLNVKHDTIQAVQTAALLHDVGRLAIPDYILNKPSDLTPAERSKLETYPRIGAEILSSCRFPVEVVPIVRSHREQWDGSGFPEGRSGEDINIGARIVGLCEQYDSYRMSGGIGDAETTKDKALAYLLEQSGKRFDPKLVRAFVENVDELEQRAEEASVLELEGVDEIASIQREHAVTMFERNEGAFRDISAARDETQLLSDFATTVGKSLSLAETLEIIMRETRKMVPCDTTAIYLKEQNKDLLLPKLVEGMHAETISRQTLRRGEGVTGWVVDNLKPTHDSDARLDFFGEAIEVGKTFASVASVPLFADEQCSGALTLYDRSKDKFTRENERILELIASKAARAIHNARAYERTKTSAVTDELTGLKNSRYLFTCLDREIQKATVAGHPVALAVLDLDQFKPINDRYGHHIGDEVLRELAKMIKSMVRPDDEVCRWGGDEFVVMSPGLDANSAHRFIREVQEAICNFDIPTSMGSTVRVGLSVGSAVYPDDGETFEQLIRVADKRMYRNKAERKGLYTDEPAGVR